LNDKREECNGEVIKKEKEGSVKCGMEKGEELVYLGESSSDGRDDDDVVVILFEDGSLAGVGQRVRHGLMCYLVSRDREDRVGRVSNT